MTREQLLERALKDAVQDIQLLWNMRFPYEQGPELESLLKRYNALLEARSSK